MIILYSEFIMSLFIRMMRTEIRRFNKVFISVKKLDNVLETLFAG